MSLKGHFQTSARLKPMSALYPINGLREAAAPRLKSARNGPTGTTEFGATDLVY
jgi:hypothetical protein